MSQPKYIVVTDNVSGSYFVASITTDATTGEIIMSIDSQAGVFAKTTTIGAAKAVRDKLNA